MGRNDAYPTSIAIQRNTTIVLWSDGIKTSATPSGGDRFDIDLGVLWALCKKFLSTSKIVTSVWAAKTFLNTTEGEMLWLISTHYMTEKDVNGILDFAKSIARR